MEETMTCRKCESSINTGTKCFQCGYDVSKGDKNSANRARTKISPAAIGLISVLIILGTITLFSNLGIILRIPAFAAIASFFSISTNVSNSVFYAFLGIPPLISAVLSIILAVFEILLCIGIVGGAKKQAFKACVIFNVVLTSITVVGGLIMYMFWIQGVFALVFPYLLKGLLLFAVYKIDGKFLGFGKDVFVEPISVKRARERRERAEQSLKENIYENSFF
jgi:hypothetical protein